MKLLVIDNLTIEMPRLNKALAKYSYDIIKYKKINTSILEKYDKIILSGCHAFTALYPNMKYKNELSLIKRCKKPMLGICLGFQLICRTYGAKMTDLKMYEKGLFKVKIIKDDQILKGIPKSFYAFENRHNIVKRISKTLVSLAVSKDGIEMVRHVSKPTWGMQFHPEHFGKKSMGRKIIRNFINMKY